MALTIPATDDPLEGDPAAYLPQLGPAGLVSAVEVADPDTPDIYSQVTVFDQIVEPGSRTPATEAQVILRLVSMTTGAAVYIPTSNQTVLAERVLELREADAGSYSFDLIPNSQMEPPSYYELTRVVTGAGIRRDPQTLRFRVPGNDSDRLSLYQVLTREDNQEMLATGLGTIRLRDISNWPAPPTGSSAMYQLVWDGEAIPHYRWVPVSTASGNAFTPQQIATITELCQSVVAQALADATTGNPEDGASLVYNATTNKLEISVENTALLTED